MLAQTCMSYSSVHGPSLHGMLTPTFAVTACMPLDVLPEEVTSTDVT